MEGWSWAGEVMGHLTDWKGKLKLSRSSSPLITLGESSPPPTNSRRPLCAQNPGSGLGQLHSTFARTDSLTDRWLTYWWHRHSALPPHCPFLSTSRKDEKISLSGNKGKKREQNMPSLKKKKNHRICFRLSPALPSSSPPPSPYFSSSFFHFFSV